MVAKMEKRSYIKLLDNAELQYKFALALNTKYNWLGEKMPKLVYYDQFAYGPYIVYKKDLELNKKQEQRAAMLLEHTVIYIMAVQIDTVLEKNIPDRFNHNNNDIRSGSCIIRLIRNTFAHNPFAPVWLIDRKFKNKVYSMGEIEMDTSKLNNKPVKRLDYGGPLALLWLSKWAKKLIS